jgi:hypothetical protein
MPRVFISYSHDSKDHAVKVRKLADRLRRDGIDCMIDQYEPDPSEGWPHWVDRQLDKADFVLIVCTAGYFLKAKEPGKSGVRFEMTLLVQELSDGGMNNGRILPVVLEDLDLGLMSRPLRPYTVYRLYLDDGYDTLYRRLTNQPAVVPPDLGSIRALPPQVVPERGGSARSLLSRQALLIAAGVASFALFPVLWLCGQKSLQARESLLGIEAQTYSTQHVLITGVDAAWSSFWRGLLTIFSQHSLLRGSALVCLGTIFCLTVSRHFGRLRRPAVLAVLAAGAMAFSLGGGFYVIALRATNLNAGDSGRGLYCGGQPGRNLADLVAFETCSWMTNDSPTNEEHRQSLSGLLGWLVATCSWAAWSGVRLGPLPSLASRLRWFLVAVHILLAVFLLRFLPLAYAYSTWGLRYPPVKLKAGCGEALAAAIGNGSCCAFDISEGAAQNLLLLRGKGCPEGPGVVTFSNSQCFVRQGGPQIIFLGCG